MDKKNTIYVGVVGQIAVGKGILVDYLIKNQGFTSYSLSSILHEELKKQGIKKFDRKILQDMGDKLRHDKGNDILARRIIELANKSHKTNTTNKPNMIVIEGIRNPGEIEYLKKNPNFILVGVKASREIRFKRLLKRGKPWDPKTFADFVKVDRRDLGVGQVKFGQQVGKCLAYCDYVLVNNKDKKDFQRKVEKLIKRVFRLNNN